MSIVVVGGNDRMVTRYKEICKAYRCKAKVFTQLTTDFEHQLGNPDFMVIFTATCSHKMVNTANRKCKQLNIPVARIHSSGASALKNVLEQYCK